MKIKLALTCIAFALANMISACGSSKKIDNERDFVAGKNTVSVNISGFDGIDNKSNVKVKYTQSPKYSILVEYVGTHIITLTKESGILLIRNADNNYDNNSQRRAVIYISAPDINSISNKGVLDFTAEMLKTDDFTTSNAGVSTLKIHKIDCDEFNLSNKGVETIEGQLLSDNVSFNTTGVTRGDKFYVEGKEFTLNNKGVINMNISFRGSLLSITNQGHGTLDVDTDCDKLKVENSGVGIINLSGTADKTDICGNGVSTINTEKLNSL